MSIKTQYDYRCTRCGNIVQRYEKKEEYEGHCFERLPFEDGEVVAKKVKLAFVGVHIGEL